MLAKPTLWIESTTWLRGTTSTAGLACGTGPPREALRDWNRTMTTVVSRMSLTARQEKPPRPPHNAAHRSSQQARPNAEERARVRRALITALAIGQESSTARGVGMAASEYDSHGWGPLA